MTGNPTTNSQTTRLSIVHFLREIKAVFLRMEIPSLSDDPRGGIHSDIGQGPIQITNIQMTPDLLNLIMQMQHTGQIDVKQSEMMTRGSWSPCEDELLATAVNQLGTKKWTDVAKCVPTRTSKQCRERWFNRLCPEIRHDPFDPWEDEIILQKQREIGNRWAIIARLLPGRSTNAIKNRWYSGLKAQHERLPEMLVPGMNVFTQHLASDLLPSHDIHISMPNDEHDNTGQPGDL